MCIVFIPLLTLFLHISSQDCSDYDRLERNSPPDGIAVYQGSPHYWQFDGKPVLLLGGSSDDNLFQADNVEEELDRLAAAGGNYVRCTMSSRDSGNVKPFEMNAQGIYDLTRFDPEYWDRLDRFLALTAERDIIVQVELWATYDFYESHWPDNPFNPAMNSACNPEDSGLPTEHSHKGWEKINPFFSTVPELDDNETVLTVQHAFADRLLEATLPHDHVLYSVDNETNAHPEWGKYWASYLKERAAGSGRTIYVTEMWDNWDPTGGRVQGISRQQFLSPHPFRERSTPMNTIDHPGIYDFIDISNHNGQIGEVHYKTGLWVREHISEREMVRPINHVKIYGGWGGTWNGNERDGMERFWRNLFAGHAAVRFHRPPSGIGNSPEALTQIRCARMLEGEAGFHSLVPATDLLNGREENEAYCLSDRDSISLVYFPARGDVILHAGPGNCTWRSLDLKTGSWEPQRTGVFPLPLHSGSTTGIIVKIDKQ